MKPPGDYQTAFNTMIGIQNSELLQNALDSGRRARCAFCNRDYPVGAMVRWNGKFFCEGLHRSYYRIVLRADQLAFTGEDEKALSVTGKTVTLGEALSELQSFVSFPSLSALLNETFPDDGVVVASAETGKVYVTERVEKEGVCLYDGEPILDYRKEGRPKKFHGPACRVAYSRLQKAIAAGKVVEMVEALDETENVEFAQPDAIDDVPGAPVVETVVKRAYTKRADSWKRREFGTLDWSDPVFATITIFADGKRARCKCGAIFGGRGFVTDGIDAFSACVRWAEMHTTQLIAHGKNMARRRDRLSVLRKVNNAGNVREWNGFVIGQTMATAWEIN